MIAMVVGDEGMRAGPIPIALASAGFEPCHTLTTDEAEWSVQEHGAQACVLIVDAGSLDRRAGSATWSSFLTRCSGVPAVVVSRGEAGPEARAAAENPHRILLEDPFDAAAVVAAARRAARRGPIRKVPRRVREAG